MKKIDKIPEATISRLSVYSRYLGHIVNDGIINISSGDIAKAVGGTPAQVRKDLAYFGDFGTRGVGYNVMNLHESILAILGLQEAWRTVLIGAGNLGSALIHFPGFAQRGFIIEAAFDNDIKKVGLHINDVPIYPITDLVNYINDNKVELAINTVPPHSAQQVAALLSDSQIKGVLNFSPTSLNLSDHIVSRDVDLAVNMEVLSFMIRHNYSLQDE